ncbi:CsgG/HfaB family protein [Kiritimatiellaeota bacterium B1221]|nr:CsgG/HfaB family protein [Kiritimatiellaeota bacterium B1221]
MKTKTMMFTMILGVALSACGLFAQAPVPIAILAFQDRGDEVKGEGEKVSEILFAELSMHPELYLVERGDLQKAMDEQELNLTGMVKPGEAVKLGQITGAKILITGSVIEAGESKYIVAKIIGTETSRVLGASVKGSIKGSTADLTEALAEKISGTVTERAKELLPVEIKLEDRIVNIVKANEGKALPTLSIQITEQHIGRATIDPAAETEFQMMAVQSGFTVVEPGAEGEAVRVVGEGFSEFAHRRGNLISVKARVEVKALDAEDRVIAVDRQTRVAVDLSEQMAAKKALQDAGADLAERMLKRLAE